MTFGAPADERGARDAMSRLILLLMLCALASPARADDVSEAALAGRWKVVGTAPTAKNRDGLAELEKHGCYLYFEFAASGRAAVGIGSDSKAKLAALQKANPGVELEWSAKYEVVNGRVEVSGFPAHLREPGGWLGDSATANFRARLDGEVLELNGPGGFVAFQKVKTKVAVGAPAHPLHGSWRFHATYHRGVEFKGDPRMEQTILLTFVEENTVWYDIIPVPGKEPLAGMKPGLYKWKYREIRDGELEYYDRPPEARVLDERKVIRLGYSIKGDTLELSPDGPEAIKIVYKRAKKK
jgi:hypothetical protein